MRSDRPSTRRAGLRAEDRRPRGGRRSDVDRQAPDALDVYLVGFHPLKDEPAHQFEAHHFCRQVNKDFMQCALFDGNTKDANLNGVEYILSERLFETLPEEERRYWHPHNGEILSGQLVAPGIPETADKELMRGKMNSYGKTWHTWGVSHGESGSEPLPLGTPRLAWSCSRFGEARSELIEGRDQRMGMSTEERRRARQDLVPLAHPQGRRQCPPRGVRYRNSRSRPARSSPAIHVCIAGRSGPRAAMPATRLCR